MKRASDGAYRWFLTRTVPDLKGSVILRWIGTRTDIHEQRITKERLEEEVAKRTTELTSSLEQLARSLREKETLLKEVHHRVKNNLQVISSLLRMQGYNVSDQKAVTALQESRQRVLSMALVHERLYGNQEFASIDFGDYSRTLVNDLLDSAYVRKNGQITGRFNLAPVQLNIDEAIPCGLILNELVTDALKYAYPEGRGGEICIALSESDAGLVTLSVSDHVVGLPASLDWKNSMSMGLPIVETLATQIDATLDVQSSPSACFTLAFTRDRPTSKKPYEKSAPGFLRQDVLFSLAQNSTFN